MVTLKEIAERCSVSIATVSNILNGKQNVSESTRERILQVIKETGYKPNYMARGLRASKTHSIGLILDDLTDFSSPGIVDGIMSHFEEYNYKTIIENLRFYSKWGTRWYQNEGYRESVSSAIEEFLAIKVDGIIYVAGHSRDINCIPSDLNIPFVISYAFTDVPGISTVEIDDVKSASNMTQYLIKNGHKSIAVVAGKKDNIHTVRRLEGIKQAAAENGLKIDDEIIVYGDWMSDSGYNACRVIFNSKKEFSAIFCLNDLMAAGVYSYLNEIGKTPQKDVSIVGFDNRTLSRYLKPSLTTMEIPLVEIGKKSAELLLNQIESDKDVATQKYFVPCNLIERNSVRDIK